MVVQKKFRQSSEQAIASFNFADIASGTGTVIYFASKTNISGAEAFNLSEKDEYSSEIELLHTTAKTTTMDFDTAIFNLPQTVRGTGLVSVGMYNTVAGACQVAVQLKKVDSAAVVTDISSEQLGSFNPIGSSGTTGVLMNLIPLSLTETIIKKGDLIRLTIKFTTLDANNNTMGYDPKGRQGTFLVAARGGSTITKVHIPFRIDR